VLLRNKLFDIGILPSTTIKDVSLIGVGNLTVGGTGKTPHVEYIVKLLDPKYKVATLSRGYGRKLGGFIIADNLSTTDQIGDEPMQFRHRFAEHIPVAVDANRVHGVKKLREHFPELQCVVLDDVFQHRWIKPGLQILLTDYGRLYYTDHMLPTGNLREPKWGDKRADVIIVTKTPQLFSPLERKRIIKEIKPQPWQKVYFSYIRYGNLLPFGNLPGLVEVEKETFINADHSIILLTGIANSDSLEYFLKDKVKELIPFRFRDHHEFSPADLLRLQDIYRNTKNEKKIVLTTEKDAMRLHKPGLDEYMGDIPLYFIPIEIAFHDQDATSFQQQIYDYVRSNPIHSKLH